MRNIFRDARMAAHLPILDRAQEAIESLGAGGRALFLLFSFMLCVSTVGLVYTLEQRTLLEVPSHGGNLTEGVIGSPRFINPILAISDTDRDLTALVYSGLLRATPEGGYVPDLAKEYEVSDDGLQYTFVLRDDATFQDGTHVVADDVVYTVSKAQSNALKSPLRANWDGVAVEALDEQTVRFSLKSAYAPFIENLTLGILPKSLWQNVSDEEFPFSELNTEPVGSGPYKVVGVERNSSGIPSSYTLRAHSSYTLGEPYIGRLTMKFYQSEDALLDALTSGEIDSASGISPVSLSEIDPQHIKTAPLNRVFGVFFNQNQSTVLRDHAVRVALSDAIDRQDLVNKVLGGYGTPLTEPLPPTLAKEVPLPSGDLIAKAQQELKAAGYTPGPDGVMQKTSGKGSSAVTTKLVFDLSTANVPELRAAAEYLRDIWGKVGVQVNVKIFEQGDLAQNVIRPRKYDALLFGEVVGREPDLFAFWHSSQRNDPGLNIALYTNQTADQALTSLRSTADEGQRAQYLATFLNELNKDMPAVFLYAPDFVYSIPNKIQGVSLGFIETPADRFLGLPNWHVETDRVWPLFAQRNQKI